MVMWSENNQKLNCINIVCLLSGKLWVSWFKFGLLSTGVGGMCNIFCILEMLVINTVRSKSSALAYINIQNCTADMWKQSLDLLWNHIMEASNFDMQLRSNCVLHIMC